MTELERFSDCSSAWFVDRLLDPKTIDAEVDPKLRGSVAHSALHKFFSGIPKELGVERLDETHARSRAAVPAPLPRPGGERRAHGDDRAAAAGARPGAAGATSRRSCAIEAASELSLVPQPVRGVVRPRALDLGGLDLGDGLSLSGKIDRVDVETFGARGIVQDYKSGRKAHSAREITQEQRLQIPLYMLVLRDLVGIEPLGGALPAARRRAQAARAAARRARRRSCRASRAPTTSTTRSSGRRLDTARDDARTLAQRIRDGRRAARSARRFVPVVVRSLAGVQGGRARERAAAGGRRRDGRSSSSRPARARARRRCSSSASCARSATTGSTCRRCS